MSIVLTTLRLAVVLVLSAIDTLVVMASLGLSTQLMSWSILAAAFSKAWNGRYIDVIDVIAAESLDATSAWVVEVETDDSVSDQWQDYNKAYQNRWYLAVPTGSKEKAQQLVNRYGISHCRVITWARAANGLHTFRGLPGL